MLELLQESYDYFAKLSVSIGFWAFQWPQAVPNSAAANILISIIFGVILGIIFSRVHTILPGRIIIKGLCFGLIVYFIQTIRESTLSLSYGYFAYIAGRNFTDFPKFALYGLVLGLLYGFLINRYYPAKEKTIITYDLKSGVLPGAMAGLVGGIAVAITNVVGLTFTGLFNIPGFPSLPTFDILIVQAGTHILFNMIWGVIFGAMFAKVYNLVSGKGITKGIIYGLIIYLISTFQIGVFTLGWGLSSSIWAITATGIWAITVGFFQFVFFGLVLGLLYKKPAEALAIKEETIRKELCKYCGTKIPEDFIFCGKCGKKQ